MPLPRWNNTDIPLIPTYVNHGLTFALIAIKNDTQMPDYGEENECWSIMPTAFVSDSTRFSYTRTQHTAWAGIKWNPDLQF